MKRFFTTLLIQIACFTFISAQIVVFKPVSATITDNQGCYTSRQFNCENMVVNDKKNIVEISIRGNKTILHQTNSSTYEATLSQDGIQVKIQAFRGVTNKKIVAVVMKTSKKNEIITIKFRP